jgi:hypothetical protein
VFREPAMVAARRGTLFDQVSASEFSRFGSVRPVPDPRRHLSRITRHRPGTFRRRLMFDVTGPLWIGPV